MISQCQDLLTFLTQHLEIRQRSITIVPIDLQTSIESNLYLLKTIEDKILSGSEITLI